MSKKVLSAILGGALILIIVGGIGSFLVYNKLLKVPPVSKSVPREIANLVPIFPSASKVTFTVSETPQTANTGQTETVSIDISSSENILAVDLDISYDPAKLVFQNIIPGNLFTQPMEFSKSIDTKAGKIFYALGSLSGSSGNGTVALVTFKPINAAERSKILLGGKTNASAKGDRKLEIVLPTY